VGKRVFIAYCVLKARLAGFMKERGYVWFADQAHGIEQKKATS